MGQDRRIRAWRTAAIAVIAATGVACSGHGGEPGQRSAPETSSPSTTATTATATPGTTAAGTSASGDAGAVAADECAEAQAWGAGPQSSDAMNPEDMYLVRAGQHPCYDRIVFDVNGPRAVGFGARYVPGEVTADPSAEPVPTAGTAALQVVVRAPAVGYGTSGHQPWRAADQVNDPYYTAEQLQGWGSLREVRFAGSFEGITTVAVGVEAELPFRVGSYEQDGISHVYLDIAHPRPGG